MCKKKTIGVALVEHAGVFGDALYLSANRTRFLREMSACRREICARVWLRFKYS